MKRATKKEEIIEQAIVANDKQSNRTLVKRIYKTNDFSIYDKGQMRTVKENPI